MANRTFPGAGGGCQRQVADPCGNPNRTAPVINQFADPNALRASRSCSGIPRVSPPPVYRQQTISEGMIQFLTANFAARREAFKQHLNEVAIPQWVEGMVNMFFQNTIPALVVKKGTDGVKKILTEQMKENAKPIAEQALTDKFGENYAEVLKNINDPNIVCTKPCICGTRSGAATGAPTECVATTPCPFEHEIKQLADRVFTELGDQLQQELPDQVKQVGEEAMEKAFNQEDVLNAIRATIPGIAKTTLRELAEVLIKNMFNEMLEAKTRNTLIPMMAQGYQPCTKQCKCAANRGPGEVALPPPPPSPMP